MRIELSSQATKFLRVCPKEVARRLVQRIKTLGEKPFPRDQKRIIGKKGVFRVRVGAYRIQYSVMAGKLFVSRIDKRSRSY